MFGKKSAAARLSPRGRFNIVRWYCRGMWVSI